MLTLVPLCTVNVKVGPTLAVGAGPFGDRSIGGFTGATVSGERLSGELLGTAAADWLIRSGSFGIIDVRMTIRTADEAIVFIQYGGRLDLSNPAAGFTAVVAPVFETGDARYGWLNRIQAIGKGRMTMNAAGVELDYDFYEVQ